MVRDRLVTWVWLPFYATCILTFPMIAGEVTRWDLAGCDPATRGGPGWLFGVDLLWYPLIVAAAVFAVRVLIWLFGAQFRDVVLLRLPWVLYGKWRLLWRMQFPKPETPGTTYLVVGPESSGTRMLTCALISVGVLGDLRHEQAFDNQIEIYWLSPAKLVLRRSIPHNGEVPELVTLIHQLRRLGYNVVPLVMDRETNAMAESQVRRLHLGDLVRANANIKMARTYLSKVLPGAPRIQYEKFVSDPTYREGIFTSLGLPKPWGWYRHRRSTCE